MTIRPANLTDLPYLYEICLKTGDAGNDASHQFQDPYMIGQYFAAPYLFFEMSACFIAEMNNRPIGYIVGTQDTKGFHQWFNSEWLPKLRPTYQAIKPQNTLEKFLCDIIQEPAISVDLTVEYPGHLHIDLLPVAQGQGLGKALMATFMDYMAKQQCRGVHLGASADNTRAVQFYRKLGFQELQLGEGAIYMGIHPERFLDQ